MNCEICYKGEVQLSDEYELNRARGNNFDIVTYEQEYTCTRCSNRTYDQEIVRENQCAATMDTTMDELSLPGIPARFDT